MHLGEYFQAQDDFLDCYGAPEVIGKIGTDIEDSKCSWLVIQALERADVTQRTLIEDFYGKTDAESVGKIKALYNEIGLPAVYEDYEAKMCVRAWSAASGLRFDSALTRLLRLSQVRANQE